MKYEVKFKNGEREVISGTPVHLSNGIPTKIGSKKLNPDNILWAERIDRTEEDF